MDFRSYVSACEQAERDELAAERDRYRQALEAIVTHADMPAGEAWEIAYIEVAQIARDALATNQKEVGG